MIGIETKDGVKYLIGALLIVAAVVSFLLVKSYIVPVLTSAVLAYLFYPIYNRLNTRLKKPNLSALIVTILIILILIVPTAFLFYHLSKEATVIYIKVTQYVAGHDAFEECTRGYVCDFLKNTETRYYIQEGVKKVTSIITSSAYNFIFSIPNRVLDILIIFFTAFFFLRDGKSIVESLRRWFPMKQDHESHIFRQMKEVTHSIVYGFFLTAIIEGALALLVFKFAGLSTAWLWAALIAVLAFVPILGPSIVWIPAAIVMAAGDKVLPLAIILAGGLAISAIDIFIKPKIIGDRAKVHPILIVLGLLGGVQLFGAIGIILGPLILALMITFIKLYREEIK